MGKFTDAWDDEIRELMNLSPNPMLLPSDIFPLSAFADQEETETERQVRSLQRQVSELKRQVDKLKLYHGPWKQVGDAFVLDPAMLAVMPPRPPPPVEDDAYELRMNSAIQRNRAKINEE